MAQSGQVPAVGGPFFPEGGPLVKEGVGRVGLRNLLLSVCVCVCVCVCEWPRDLLPQELASQAWHGHPHGQTCLHSSSKLPFPALTWDIPE